MTFKANDYAWTTKGATLSHKSAEKEFGLTFDEIVAAIRAGKLQYRENSIYGAPFLRERFKSSRVRLGNGHIHPNLPD